MFGFPYEVSPLMASPWLRFHVFWISLGLGLTGFRFPWASVSLILDFPGLMFHMFWHSMRGFANFGFPRA